MNEKRYEGTPLKVVGRECLLLCSESSKFNERLLVRRSFTVSSLSLGRDVIKFCVTVSNT